MPEYRTWRWQWRDKRTGERGEYVSGSEGLQSSEDVAEHARKWAHLEFIDCQPYHFPAIRDTEGKPLSAKPIDPDHFMAQPIAVMRGEIKRYLQSIGRYSGKTTRVSDLMRAAAEVTKTTPKQQNTEPHAEPTAAPRPPGSYRSRFVRLHLS